LYVHELQVIPELQSKGLGTGVMQDVIAQAGASGLPVSAQSSHGQFTSPGGGTGGRRYVNILSV
ncbi:MAG: hypothetical protein ABGY72_10665, partial [bacterium]